MVTRKHIDFVYDTDFVDSDMVIQEWEGMMFILGLNQYEFRDRNRRRRKHPCTR